MTHDYPRASAAVLALLVLLSSVGPALAATETCESHGLQYNCVTETVSQSVTSIAYENGEYGTVPFNTTRSQFDAWPANLTDLSGRNVPNILNGIRMGASVEMNVTFQSRDSVTVTPSTVPIGESTSPMVPVLAFSVRLNATNIMSGSSAFVYRSPIIMNEGENERHALRITDNSTGREVYNGSAPFGSQTMVYEKRAYYYIVGELRSGHDLWVEEYVSLPSGVLGLRYIDVALAQRADVGLDGTRTTYIFPSSAAGINSFDKDDVSYSFVFLHGLGPAGVENLVTGDDSAHTARVLTTQRIPGAIHATGTGNGPNQALVVIPLRTSAPLDMTLKLFVQRVDGLTESVHTVNIVGVTGTVIQELPIDDPSSSQNHYSVSLEWVQPAGSATTYVMIPTSDSTGARATHTVAVCSVSNPTDCSQQLTAHYGAWFEVREKTIAAPAPVDASVKGTDALQERNRIVGSILLLAGLLTLPVSIPLAFATGGTGGYLVATNGGVDPAAARAFVNALSDAVAFAGVIACLGATVRGGVVAATVVCGAAAGAALWALDIPVFKVIANAIEVVGFYAAKTWAFLDEWVLPVLGAVLAALALIVGLYTFVGGAKLVTIILLAPIAPMLGYRRARDWDTFDRIYSTYLPVWSDVIERRLLKMEVYA